MGLRGRRDQRPEELYTYARIYTRTNYFVRRCVWVRLPVAGTRRLRAKC